MTQDTEDVVALLAAEIMAAMRRAKFPKDHVAEAHDEFEALTLVPMIRETLLADRQSLSDRIDVLEDENLKLRDALLTIEDVWTLPTDDPPPDRKWHCQHEEMVSAISGAARAALHQEGIAPK